MPTVRPFGASVKRVEDPKYLLGRAQCVDDVKLPGTASVAVKGRFVMNRHCASPMEGRAVLAHFDPAYDKMTVWTSTQMPHMVRTKIADYIGFPEQKIVVIGGPDVGGGFGLKCHIFPE